MTLPQILIGWPAILTSLLLSAAGAALKRPALQVAGAILCLGFALYLFMWPNFIFKTIGLTLPLTHLLGALAVRRQKAWIAWPLLLPHAAIAAYLGAIVLSQH